MNYRRNYLSLKHFYLLRIEFLELLNKIFIHLDSKWAIDIRNDNQDTIVYKISEFMKILNYPANYD